jgi:hypothetical protein
MKRLSYGSASIYALADQRKDLWPAIVLATYREFMGGMAKNLPAVDFSDGILRVAARNKTWKKEGQSFEENIMKALNGIFERELISSIEWVSWPEPVSRQSQESAIISKPDELPKELKAVCRRISQEEVRKAFGTFAAAVLRSRMTESKRV